MKIERVTRIVRLLWWLCMWLGWALVIVLGVLGFAWAAWFVGLTLAASGAAQFVAWLDDDDGQIGFFAALICDLFESDDDP